MNDEQKDDREPVKPVLELRASGKGFVTKPDGTVVHFEFEGKANGNDSDVN
jgi:hypothetical protein